MFKNNDGSKCFLGHWDTCLHKASGSNVRAPSMWIIRSQGSQNAEVGITYISSFINGETEARTRRGLGMCHVVRGNGTAKCSQTWLHIRNTWEASKNIHALDSTPKPKPIYCDSLEKVCGPSILVEKRVCREKKNEPTFRSLKFSTWLYH